MLEFDTRISRGETPVNGSLSMIALLLPGTNSLLCLLKPVLHKALLHPYDRREAYPKRLLDLLI